jgi:hypothetical protein
MVTCVHRSRPLQKPPTPKIAEISPVPPPDVKAISTDVFTEEKTTPTSVNSRVHGDMRPPPPTCGQAPSALEIADILLVPQVLVKVVVSEAKSAEETTPTSVAGMTTVLLTCRRQ